MKKLFAPFTSTILLISIISLAGCSATSTNDLLTENSTQPIVVSAKTNPNHRVGLDLRLQSAVTVIFEDSKGNIWFGTEHDGPCMYDGKVYTYFTRYDPSLFSAVLAILEDKNGTIWVRTKNTLSRLDGEVLESVSLKDVQNREDDWQITPDNLWFTAGGFGHVYRLEGEKISHLTIPKPDENATEAQKSASRFGVFSVLKAKNQTLWLGTHGAGVVTFDGNEFTYINDKNLDFSVMSIFEDSKGNMWFGNDGAGVFKYTKNGLVNVTAEHGLSDQNILLTHRISTQAKTLARVWAIEEDAQGNMWFGTLGTGVWKYDGTHFTNYTTEDGLPSNEIRSIKKDKNGTLWFGTGYGGVFILKGEKFILLSQNRTEGC